MMNTGNEKENSIIVFISDERFRYHTHEILSAFFPAENIVYLNENILSPAGWYMSLYVQESADDFNFTAEIFFDGDIKGKYIFKATESAFFRDPEGATLLIRSRKALKAKLYDIFSYIKNKQLPWGNVTGIRPAKMVNSLYSLGMSDREVFSELIEKYKVNDKKARLVMNVARTQREILKDAGRRNISLYIGIPFCPTRCLYCSFTSNPINKYRSIVGEYIDTLIYEMKSTEELLGSGDISIESIYIGGGTPTSLTPEYLDILLGTVRSIWGKYGIAKEFCVEAGRPDSIDIEKLKILKKYGITRISVNPQTLNDETLELIGRKHTSEQFFKAFYQARNEGFDNINVDMIAGLPGESFEMFKHTLEGILSLSPENLTVHTMSIKRASDLKKYSGNYVLTDGDVVEKMVEEAYDALTLSGYDPFYMYRQKNMLGNLENVSYTKPGFESYYNVHIMEEDQTILAFGAGAVSKFVLDGVIERAFNVKNVEEYIKRKEEMIDRKRIFVYNYLVG